MLKIGSGKARWALLAQSICAALLFSGCNGSGRAPDGVASGATARSSLRKGGAGAINAPSISASAPAPVGVIVRLKGPSAFDRHALERPRGRAAAMAAAKGQRTQLRTQHNRVMGALARTLGVLPARRGKGIVLGRSFDDFTDVINAIALHGVDETLARSLLQNDADVVSIEPIREVHATLPESVPVIEADKVWAIADSNGIAIDGAGMRIGILDTGVDYTHPDLGGCFGAGCKVAAGYDFVNNDADPMDDHGHGTHVSATAAGNGTYAGPGGLLPIRGVAPGAQIYAYKVLSAGGGGGSDGIIAAIERCVDPNSDGDPSDHLDVCSMSLGGGGDPDDAMSLAVDAAVASGVVFSIAAGNSGPGESTIGSPGTSRRAITVAAACKPSAVGFDGSCMLPIASFSSRGPVVWNGVGGLQTLAKPDVAAPGVSICAAEWGAYSAGSRCLDGRHIAISGTSMATPHIAGVVALLRQAHPEWTADQVKMFVVTSARTFGLDPSIQGAGMVDVLDALQLGGVPSQIARVGGTPLRDIDVPTTRFGEFSSALTITNTTPSTLSFTGAFAGDAGLTATLTPPGFTVASGATATVTVARRVDHDVVASGVEARGTITFSSAQGDIKVGLQVGVRDRLGVTPTPVDLGVDLASQATWTGQATLQLANVRTDVPQTYAASISCCVSAGQNGNGSIVATLDSSSVTVGAGGTASLGVTVTATNGALPSGRYLGSISLTSALGALTIPVTFFKGYGLRIDAPSTPDAVAVSSAQSGSTTFNPSGPSTTFYSMTPGPFYVEGAWLYLDRTWKHVLAVVNGGAGLATVTLDPAQAIYTFDVQPRNELGQPFADTLTMMYRFTHSASGGGILRVIGAGGPDVAPIYVSAIPAGINFTASAVGASPDPIGYLYELAGPISSNQLFTNTGTDVITKEVRLFQPGADVQPLAFVPSACLTWQPWTSDPPGGPVNGVSANCTVSSGVVWPSGVGRMLFYNSSNRDLLAAPYPDAPAVSYDLHAGSPAGPYLGRGPNLWVSATHPLTWLVPIPWLGTLRLNEIYARFRCDEPPGNVLPVGSGPLQDQWVWRNHQGAPGFVGGYKGAFNNPFIWGGCVQENDFTTYPVSYRLYRDGTLMQDGTIAGESAISPPPVDGQYRFEMTRSPTIVGVSTTVETVSTFERSSVMSIDENPPAIHGLHLLGRGLWQQVLDPAVVDRLRFNVDPMPGDGDWNPNAPPSYLPLADGLAQLDVQQSTDGVLWKQVPTTALPNGDYATDVLDVDPTAPLTSFRIFATDLAGNTLRYTFQMPRGASYGPAGGDVTAPSTSITSPSAGATLTGVATVSAVASDDVGVTRVDLLLDGAMIGTATSPPYAFPLNTSLFTTGTHALRTRAQDAAENVGYSAPVSVTVQNADTTPPTVSFAAPAAGALVNGVISVTANASDNAQVARVEIYDGTTLLGTPTAPPYTVSWNTAAGADSTRTLKAVATDPAGNAAQATRAVSVDNTPPTVTWTAPADGSIVGGTVTLTAAVTDNVGVAHVDFWLNDYALVGSATTPPYSVPWNASVYSGVFQFRARAYDTAGNMAQTALVTVTVPTDQTPPAVAITSPVEGATIGAYSNVQISATDTNGIGGLELYDGGTLVNSGLSGPPWSLDYDATDRPDGPHTLTVHAMDLNGNIGISAPVHVTVDKTPPTIAITAPANGVVVSGTVNFKANVADNGTIAFVEFYDDDILLATDTAAPYATTWNTLGAPARGHVLLVRAYDTVGNLGQAAIVVTILPDATPPTVSITAPANGAVITGTVAFTATAGDNIGVARVELRDGNTVVATLTSSPYTFNWNTASVATGTHTLTARAFDAAGNSATSASRSVTIDRTAPTVALSAPASGATVSGTVTVSATASDSAGLARVEFYRDGTILIGTDTTSPYSISWNTTTTAAGSHPLTARAFDIAGNAKTSSSRSVTVKDITAPTVSLTSPANGARVNVGATITMAATATDATGVTKVEFRVNNVLTCTDQTAPYTCAWKVPSGTNKTYTLVAKAYDAASNTRTATVSVTSR